MPSPRSGLRRAAIVAVVGAMFTGLLAVPISAATATVTGTLTYRERVPLGPEAVAIVTIVDHTAAPEAGAVIGQQRIDAPAAVPLDFSVVVDADAIDPTHAYGLYATIIDGTSTWDNRIGEPVITGGPTNGIALTLTAVSPTPPAAIGGTIAPPEGTELGPAAVSIVALIKLETGTLVSRQVRPIADPADLSFSIGFDPALVDPAATYVVKGGVIDGAAVWQNRAGVTAITGGVAVATISLPVDRAATDLPVSSPFPTAIPSGSAAATSTPGATATAAPTASSAPTATAAPTATPTPPPTPTPAPAATPTPVATSTPTAAATPTSTPAPTSTPTSAPSGAPSPTPIGGPVTGTLTYPEPYQLSGDAFAVVALVRGVARASESSIVASVIDRDISAKPVPFELALEGVTIDPSQTYTIQATIVDGENAWVTAQGIPVLTKGHPSTVEITLSYRPDLLKGAVSGQITAIGPQPSAGAYAMAVLVDPVTGESLGIDVKTITDGLPVAFAIGYTITDIDPTGDYVVTAEVGEGDALWRNVAGVPVITDGNPTSGIQVAVTAVAAPTPSASPAPSATPAPTPAPDATGGSGLLPWIVLVAIVAAVAAFFIARSRNEAERQPPEPGRASPTGAPTEADAPTEPEAPTEAPEAPETPAPAEGAEVAAPSAPSTGAEPSLAEAPVSDPGADPDATPPPR